MGARREKQRSTGNDKKSRTTGGKARVRHVLLPRKDEKMISRTDGPINTHAVESQLAKYLKPRKTDEWPRNREAGWSRLLWVVEFERRLAAGDPLIQVIS